MPRRKVEEAKPGEFDMTPMIDVTFQLIVFFLIANDLSKKEVVDLELPQAVHPWYVGVQFHPEFKSTPWAGHPLFNAYVKAALTHQAQRVPAKAVA